MKRFINLFISLTVLLLLSCSNGFNTKLSKGSLSITLPWSQPRAAWLKSDITEYKVTLSKDTDNFETQTKSSTPENPTITFDELETGEYTVKVLAYNNETEIATGQTKVIVIEGETATANVRISLYQTKGGDEPEKDADPVDDNPSDDDTLKFDIPFYAETLEDTKFYKVIISVGDEPLDENDPFNKLPGKSYIQIKNEQNAFMDGMIFPGFNINLYTPSVNEEKPEITTLRENFIVTFATHDFIVLTNPEDEEDICMLFTEYGYANYIKNPDSLKDIFDVDELIPTKIDYLLPYSKELINKKLPQLYSKLYDAYKDEETIPNLWELSEEQLDELDIAKITIALNFLGSEQPFSYFYIPEGDFEPKAPVSTENDITYVLCTNLELTALVPNTITAKGNITLYLGQLAPETPDNPPETPETPKEVTVTFNCNYNNCPNAVQWTDVNPKIETMVIAYNTLIDDSNFRYGSRIDTTDKKEKYFCGWSVDKSVQTPEEATTILQVGDKYQFTKDVTLYAVWCDSDAFFEDTGNFEIDYELPGYETYRVYYLNSHRDNITIPRFKHLFPDITFPINTNPYWKFTEETTEEEKQFFDNEIMEGKTYKKTVPFSSFKIIYYFSIFAANFCDNYNSVRSGLPDYHLEEIKDYSKITHEDGHFYYYLPNDYTTFDSGMRKPDDYNFKFWSLSTDNPEPIIRIDLEEFDIKNYIYAIWEADPDPIPDSISIHITSAEDLLKYTYSKYDSTLIYSVYLDENIVLDSWTTTLLSGSGKEFNGAFFGKNHTITINDAQYPLFWDIKSDSVVQDLTLNINCSTYTNSTGVRSLFCLTNYGNVSNCKITGIVSSNSLTSLFGDGEVSTFYNCSASVTDSASNSVDIKLFEKGITKSGFLNTKYCKFINITKEPTDYTQLNFMSNCETNLKATTVINYTSSEKTLSLEEYSSGTELQFILKSDDNTNPFGGADDAIITIKCILNIGMICDYNGTPYYLATQEGYNTFSTLGSINYILKTQPTSIDEIVAALNTTPML